MNAQFLKQFSYESPPLKQLMRSPNVQTMYDCFVKTPGYPAFVEGIKERLKSQKYIVIENMFPYDVVPPIQHKCIWYTGELSKQQVEAIIAHQGLESITFFENPDELKSIKAVKHYHLFHF